MPDNTNPIEVTMTNVSDRQRVNVGAPSVGRGSAGPGPAAPSSSKVVFDLDNVSNFYGAYEAVRRTSMKIGKNEITALIGPSGCGKSTVLRSLNRMNDLIPGARVSGKIRFYGRGSLRLRR